MAPVTVEGGCRRDHTREERTRKRTSSGADNYHRRNVPNVSRRLILLLPALLPVLPNQTVCSGAVSYAVTFR